MVKLKLTAWAEERIKSQLDTFTTTDLIVDPEVKAAYETGSIDFGDNTQAMFTKDGKNIIIRQFNREHSKGVEMSYSKRTWQVYNPPRISKRR